MSRGKESLLSKILKYAGTGLLGAVIGAGVGFGIVEFNCYNKDFEMSMAGDILSFSGDVVIRSDSKGAKKGIYRKVKGKYTKISGEDIMLADFVLGLNEVEDLIKYGPLGGAIGLTTGLIGCYLIRKGSKP